MCYWQGLRCCLNMCAAEGAATSKAPWLTRCGHSDCCKQWQALALQGLTSGKSESCMDACRGHMHVRAIDAEALPAHATDASPMAAGHVKKFGAQLTTIPHLDLPGQTRITMAQWHNSTRPSIGGPVAKWQNPCLGPVPPQSARRSPRGQPDVSSRCCSLLGC